MKEYRTLLVALGILVLLTPAGLYLPEIVKAGAAWGEWGIDEVREMIGYAPAGMEKDAGAWKAPMPEYGFPGREDASLPRRGVHYLLSAFLGVLLCGGMTYLIVRLVSGRGRKSPGGRP
jgi:hypothetical protein